MQGTNSCYKTNARFAGVMYLLCMAASILGGLMINGVFDTPDFINNVSEKKMTLIAGTALELMNAFGVMGIAAAFWAPLKEKMPATASGYFGLRSIETALCIIVAFIPVLLIQLTAQQVDVSSSVKFYADMLVVVRDVYWAYVYAIIFFVSGLLFYAMLFKTGFVPKYISVWGIVALFGVLAAMFVPSIKFIPGLLIILNEIYLGFFLIFKGLQIQEEMV